MLYLARILHRENGEIQHNMVVKCSGGMLLNVQPFEREGQSMLLVEEVYISLLPSLESLPLSVCAVADASVLYAYSADSKGVLKPLE